MNARAAPLIAAASVAPLFWLGQVLLGYFVAAQGCYPGDAPRPAVTIPALQSLVWSFDGIALAAALAGGAISLLAWRRLGQDHDAAVATGEGPARFLTLWGVYSSLWFFFAILFNTIATVTVPPCAI